MNEKIKLLISHTIYCNQIVNQKFGAIELKINGAINLVYKLA